MLYIKSVYFKCLLGLLFLPLMSSAQTEGEANAFIKKLVAKKYISAAEAQQVERDDVLLTLYDVYLARAGIERGELRGGAFYLFVNEKKNLKLVEYLYSHHLIDEATYEDLLKLTENKSENKRSYVSALSDDFDILHYLYEWQRFQESKDDGKAEAYLQQLKAISLIDQGEELDLSKMKSRKDVLDKFQSVLFINTNELPDDMETRYRFLYGETKKLDPSFEISDVRFSVVENSYSLGSERRTYQTARMAFTCGNRSYRADNSHYDEEYAKSGLSTFDYFFYSVFNKILVDQGASNRIFETQVNEKEWAFMLLDTTQYKTLLAAKSDAEFRYYDPNWYEIPVSKYGNPFDLLSSDSISHCFQQYDSIGLFSHLSQEEREKLEKDCVYQNLNACAIIIDLADLWYGEGWEMYELDQPYKKVILEFARLSRGVFTPTEIEDNFCPSADYAEISFMFKGKKYAKRLEVWADWFDGSFLELIMQAMDDNELPGKFYSLGSGEDGFAYIFLSPTQYEYLQTHGLLDFGE